MKQREIIQKFSEWDSIKNVIPTIESYLGLTKIFHDSTFERECPDFVFYNNSLSIGIEVTECHPSVQKNKKTNAPATKSFKERISQMFLANEFLSSITLERKLNILVDCGMNFRLSSNPKDVCNSIENHLRSWYHKTKCEDLSLIRRIRVHETKGKNIVQFNNIARRDPIGCLNLKKSISEKNEKFVKYAKNSSCDEYWLCIHLPFEENRQSNCIEWDMNNNIDFTNFVSSSKYDRIFITSVLPNDLKWLKGIILSPDSSFQD